MESVWSAATHFLLRDTRHCFKSGNTQENLTVAIFPQLCDSIIISVKLDSQMKDELSVKVAAVWHP